MLKDTGNAEIQILPYVYVVEKLFDLTCREGGRSAVPDHPVLYSALSFFVLDEVLYSVLSFFSLVCT